MSAYTTVTHTSWFSRIKSALAGIIIGPICIVLAIWLLWYNEGRAVERAQDLSLGVKLVQEITSETYDPSLDTKLVHISAPITGINLSDTTFGVSLSGASLQRKVEMFQWKQHESSQTKENLGGSTDTTKTYTYAKVWSTELIDSASFVETGKYINPNSFTYLEENFLDENFKLGVFRLSQNLLTSLPNGKEVSLAEQKLTLGTGQTLQNNTIFIGSDVQNPQIGDMKISYNALQNGEVLSVIAAQTKEGILAPYQAKNKTLSRISLGTLTAQEMFAAMVTENKLTTWGLRIIGLALMYIGWSAFFAIIPILGAVIPLFGKILSFGTGFIASILTLLLGGTVIILAWIVARPLFAILGALALLALIYFLWKHKKEKTTGNITETPTSV